LTGQTLTVTAAALGATAFYALSTALKHRTAGLTPQVRGAGRGALGRFVLATARHPIWLAAIAADTAGLALQVLALHLGALSVVQLIMITALVFSLVLAHRFAHTRMSVEEVAGGVVLVAALLGFLAISGASSPSISGSAQPADHVPAIVIGAAAVAVAVLCVLLARQVPRGLAAALLGIAAGLTYAMTAALIKSCSDVALSQGVDALLTSWQLYVLVVAGLIGLVLGQLAFQSGPLRASLPAIAIVDPLVSIAVGVFVYDEHLRPGLAAMTGELVCLLVLCAAAIYLGRIRGDQEAALTQTRPAASIAACSDVM
jgi:drug/metabolite transporter (DMT)-like permease